MNHTQIIAHAERLYTISKRVAVSDDAQARRDDLVVEFGSLATEIGKIAQRRWKPDWTRVQMAIVDLHSAAVYADERRSGTFVRLGDETVLVTSLAALAACLGFVLDDAATAPTDEHDEAAMAAVEMRQEFHHAAE
tara:strand:+ start:6598 stop:7005 length:408 start_codon:yes stop_codon:yes gene_type:complete